MKRRFFFAYFCSTKNKSVFVMKVKLTPEQIQRIVDDPVAAAESKVKVTDPWWMVVIKVVKYICELILAGAGGYLAISCAKPVLGL